MAKEGATALFLVFLLKTTSHGFLRLFWQLRRLSLQWQVEKSWKCENLLGSVIKRKSHSKGGVSFIQKELSTNKECKKVIKKSYPLKILSMSCGGPLCMMVKQGQYIKIKKNLFKMLFLHGQSRHLVKLSYFFPRYISKQPYYLLSTNG